jgi:O-antigen/teichoic acid export membrane protein
VTAVGGSGPGLRQQAARGVGWTVLDKWANRLVGTLVLVVLTRLLRPSDFGVVALASVLTSLIALLRDVGFTHAIVQRKEIEREHLDSAFWMSVGMGIATFGLAQLLAAPAAAVTDAPRLEGVIRWLSIAFVIGGLRSTPAAILTRDLHFRALAVRNVASTTAGGVVGIIVALSGGGVWSLVAQELTDTAVDAVMLWFSVPWRPRRQVSGRHLRELIAFSTNVLGIQVMQLAFRRSDDLVVGIGLGNAALGLYSVGYRLLRMVSELFVSTISAVGFPALARVQDDPSRFRRAAELALRGTAVISIPAFALLGLTAPEVTRVVFGDRWLGAISITQVLAVGGLTQPIFTYAGQVLLAGGRARTALWHSVANGLLSLAAFLVAIPHGLVAVAIAYSVRGFLILPLSLHLAARQTGITARTAVGHCMPPLVAGGAMAATTLLIDLTPFPDLPQLVLKAACGLAVYVGTLRVLFPGLAAEAAPLVSAVLPRRRRPTIS